MDVGISSLFVGQGQLYSVVWATVLPLVSSPAPGKSRQSTTPMKHADYLAVLRSTLFPTDLSDPHNLSHSSVCWEAGYREMAAGLNQCLLNTMKRTVDSPAGSSVHVYLSTISQVVRETSKTHNRYQPFSNLM